MGRAKLRLGRGTRQREEGKEKDRTSLNGSLPTVGVRDSSVPDVDRQQLFQEISSNTWRFGFHQERLLNPDELVGRKGQRIYRQMLADDQVKAALSLKKHAILSTGWDIAPASDSSQDVEVAEFCKFVFEKMDGSLDDDLLEILSGLEAGYSVTELVHRPITSGVFTGKIGLRALKTRRPDEFVFLVDAHDNLLENGIEQFGRKMPSWKFVIFSYQKCFDNYYGLSDLRAAYTPWWAKDFARKAQSIFLDRYSVPLALGTYPAGNATLENQISAFRSALENLQLATTITMPDNFKVDFPAIGAQGSSVFAQAINQQDQAIARAILVPNLMGVSPQGDVGSYSQARKQFDVFILVIEKLQRDLAETVVGEQIIRRLVDLNYRVEEYPTFMFLPFTETDKSSLLSMFFQAIAAGGVTPRPEDEAHIRMVTEFPEIPLEELQEAAETAKAQHNLLGGDDGAAVSIDQEGTDLESGRGEEPDEKDEGDESVELSDEELDTLINEVLGKQYEFDPNQPRDEDGRWSDEQASVGAATDRELSTKPAYGREWITWAGKTQKRATRENNVEAQKIQDRMLKVGGRLAVIDNRDPDLKALASRGQFFRANSPIKAFGRDHQCHWNAVDAFRKGKADAVVTGYVLDEDRAVWRQHSWGLKGNRVVETTEGNFGSKAYFGVAFRTKADVAAFAKRIGRRPE